MKKTGLWRILLLMASIATISRSAMAGVPATAPAAGGPAGDHLFDPTLITLHMKKATPQAVYAEIFRQAKLPMRLNTPEMFSWKNLPPINLDVDRKPFWEVMYTLGETTGTNLAHEGSEFPLGYCGMDWKAWSLSGAVAILPMSVWYLHNTPLDGSTAEAGYFYVDLVLEYEPKLWVTSTSPAVKVTEAVDDRGNSLVPVAAPAAVEEFQYSGFPNCRADLKYPAHNAGTKIVRLRGTIAMTVATRIAHVEIPAILSAGPTGMTVNGETFRFIKCEQDRQQYKVTIEAPADHSAERRRLFADAASRMEMQDAQGRELTLSREGLNSDPDKPTMTLTFLAYAGVSQPDRLVWNAAAEVKHVEAPVDLHNLKMDMGNQ